MERPQRQLRTWFPDGLCGNNANRRTFFNQFSGTHIPSVTLCTNPKRTVTGQGASDSDSIKPQSFNLCCRFSCYDLILVHNHFICNRVANIVSCGSSNNKLRKWNIDLLTSADNALCDSLQCLAVSFKNNNILSDIDKLSCKISGISCLQCRICQPLTRPVGRAKVLKYSQSFSEVRLNWRFDNLAAWLCH
ncbi:hypothetical protein ES703_74601 [subsurface metagenome]